MKSIKEIETLLKSELNQHLDKIKSNSILDCFNDKLEDTSFILAGLLNMLLKNNNPNWKEKWIDDSLITKVKFDNDKISIWGIMIWGKDDTTEQWTEPFYFETFSSNFKQYFFLFGDLDCPEIRYEEFNQNRNFWDLCFYSNDQWIPFERKWKYQITSK